jgi:hypothetical protein
MHIRSMSENTKISKNFYALEVRDGAGISLTTSCRLGAPHHKYRDQTFFALHVTSRSSDPVAVSPNRAPWSTVDPDAKTPVCYVND